MRRAVLRFGETLSPRALGLTAAATAGLFGISHLIRSRKASAAQDDRAAPFKPETDVPQVAGGEESSPANLAPPSAAADGEAAGDDAPGGDAPAGDGAPAEAAAGEAKAEPGDDDAVPENLVRREERPKKDRDTNCAAVFRVVSDSFDELVLSGDAAELDVLVLVHQEGCSACGALAPRLRMLAGMLGILPEGKKVRIAMLNGTQNNPLPDAINTRAFPRLVMFPKGDKANPVMIRMLEKEEGGRAGLPTVSEILDFVEGTSGARFRVTPGMRDAALAMEQEAELLNLLLLRSDNLLGIGLALAGAGGGGEAGEDGGGHGGAFGRALDRYTKRVMLVNEACHALSDRGRWQYLGRVVDKCESNLSKLARTADVAPPPPAKDGEEPPPAMGPALMRMLFLYERSAHAWGDSGPPGYAPLLERSDLRVLAAKTELLARLEDARRADASRA